MPGEDVVRHRGDVVLVAQGVTQRQHESRLSGPDGAVFGVSGFLNRIGNSRIPANADGKGPVLPVAALDEGHLAAQIRTRAVEDLVRVAVAAKVIVGVADAVVVGVGVGHLMW